MNIVKKKKTYQVSLKSPSCASLDYLGRFFDAVVLTTP